MLNLLGIFITFPYPSKNSWKNNGGWGEIRTHGELSPTPVFKTGALNRSATHPIRIQ